jgi:phosphopantetheinyl transferase (holo-ACP synthase)
VTVFVGNDVVDLVSPRTAGRAADARFVARVLGADEQELLRASGGSDVELWSLWAAKEAGFKAISKVIGQQPAFVHRAFAVRWSRVEAEPVVGGHAPKAEREHAVDRDDGTLVREGHVEHGERIASVSVRWLPGAIHAVAVCAGGDGGRPPEVQRRVARLEDPSSRWSAPLEELMLHFSAREADAIRSRESAAVRLGARADAARLLGVPEDRVEIVCDPGPSTRRPPRVLVEGREAHADISLSHDGGWIAWAIWVGA